MVDMSVLETGVRKGVRVQVPLSALIYLRLIFFISSKVCCIFELWKKL